MPNFHVIPEKCKKCYTCVRECPALALVVDEETKLPYAFEGSSCINCGHCVILCPYEASELEQFPKEDYRSVKLSNMPTFEQCEVLFKTRRSARQYKDKLVPREKIDQLIDVIRYAPTGANKQEIRWIVCENAETTAKAYELVKEYLTYLKDHPENPNYEPLFNSIHRVLDLNKDNIFRGAHQFVVATLPKDFLTKEDAIIGLTYFEMACHSMGLACCWGGLLTMMLRDYRPLRELLGIDEDQYVCEVQLFGYNKIQRCGNLPPRNPLNLKFC